MERQRFLNDPLFNTLQSDLYDSDMAEVLGRIETSVLPDFTNYDWSEGKTATTHSISPRRRPI